MLSSMMRFRRHWLGWYHRKANSASLIKCSGSKSGTSDAVTQSTARTFSSIPEEIRQEIISYLDYYDAWSLKQTSKLFLRVVEIPTIATFLAQPYGRALNMLEDWDIIPIGYEGCFHCRRLFPAHHFSRFQRWISSARQKSGLSGTYRYESYKPDKHFCIQCGVKEGQYPFGQRIFVGFGEPGTANEAMLPCPYCSLIVDNTSACCELCGGCDDCIAFVKRAKAQGFPVAFFDKDRCDHFATIALCASLKAWELRGSYDLKWVEMSNMRPVGEPVFKEYKDKSPEDLLAMIGEKLTPRGKDAKAFSSATPGYLIAVE